MTWRIEVQDARGETSSHRLTGDRLLLGRSPEADLQFAEDTSLSRRHLAFERGPEGWIVRDLESKNGTWLNGMRLEGPGRLRSGDRLQAGSISMQVFDAAASRDTGVVFSTAPLPEGERGTMQLDLHQVLPELARAGGGATTTGSTALRPDGVEILVRAGRELVRNRPLDELFDLILELALQAVDAERGLLMTVEEDGLQVRAAKGEGFEISSAVRDRVLEERKSLLVRDTRLDEQFRNRESIAAENIRTMMAVPLQTDERCIGLVYVDSRFLVKDFDEDDLNLLTVLANVAAIRIEHERLAEVERMERELQWDLDQAAEIQRGLLPRAAPEVEGFEMLGHNVPCKTVGGDYFDFFTYPDGRVALVLADVSGKGTPGAILMCGLQARVQVLAQEPEELGELMGRLDRSMAENSPGNRFVSLFFAVYDPATGTLRSCNAGHNPPLLVRASGEVERIQAGGTVLGVLPEMGYEPGTTELAPGDLLAVYSDGLTEATNEEEEELGEESLERLLVELRSQPLDEILGRVREELAAWTGGRRPEDDVTLVLARRPA